MPSDGGDEVQVTKNGGWYPRESEEGQHVYFHKIESTWSPSDLWTIPAEDGQETKILDSVWPRSFEVLRGGIYFIRLPGPHAGPSLQLYSFVNKTSREIARFEKFHEMGFSISPDGNSVVYPQIENSNADLMLVENFK